MPFFRLTRLTWATEPAKRWEDDMTKISTSRRANQHSHCLRGPAAYTVPEGASEAKHSSRCFTSLPSCSRKGLLYPKSLASSFLSPPVIHKIKESIDNGQPWQRYFWIPTDVLSFVLPMLPGLNHFEILLVTEPGNIHMVCPDHHAPIILCVLLL